MRCVFINLDRATDRRRFMERQGERLGLALERLPAVVAQDISDETLRAIGRAWERPLTKPELGCFLSHKTLWAEVAAGDEPILVLEDDVVLSPRIVALIGAVPSLSGMDFLNLESFDRRRFLRRRSEAIAEGLRAIEVSRDKSGSAAYVVWPDGARKLSARAKRGAAPVDAFLHGLRALDAYQVEPALAMQVHLLEKRGIAVPIPTATFIQAPRDGLPLRPGNLVFHARRVATQLWLAGEHLKRLFGNRYRLVDLVEADFVPPADDQSRS